MARRLACLPWLLAAGVVHALPALGLLFAPRPAAARRAAPIEVTLAPAAPAPTPAPEVQPEPSPAPAPPAAPTRRARRAAPKPAPAGPPAPAPRRVVGLSLGATVQGGGGPAFAVGNTLEGRTAAVAEAPVREAAPPQPAPAPSLNRRARAAPGSEVTLTRPRRLRRVEPTYPDELRALGVEADVMVQVELTDRGEVKAARILRPAAQGAFNQAALAAAWQERFAPAARDGVPIEYTLSFTYRFRASE